MGRKTIMNQNAPIELVEKINPINIELMEEFLDYLESMQRSNNTIEAYKIDILGAFCWCVQFNENRSFIEWTKRQIIKFQNYMVKDLKNSPARIKRVKSSLSSFSNFIENMMEEDYPNFRNKIKAVESPVNQPVREKTILTEEQLNIMLERFLSKGRPDRACVLALAAYSGRRIAELVRFRVSDFADDHIVCNGALYKSDPIKTKGRGVNGKMLECYTLAKQFKPYLDAWLEYRQANGIESIWLFPDSKNPEKHMDKSILESMAKHISKFLGIDFYWHSVRHFVVTKFVQSGIPDSVIQQYIGWSDISMVPVYTDLGADAQLSMYFDGANSDGLKDVEAKSLGDI